MMKMTGSFCTAAKFVPSCAAAVLVEPSPTHARRTQETPRVQRGVLVVLGPLDDRPPLRVALHRFAERPHQRGVGLPIDVLGGIKCGEAVHGGRVVALTSEV